MSEKDLSYFNHARKQILALLPEHSAVALELGCGSGATLGWLKEEGFVSKSIGVEIDREAVQCAEKVIDQVFCGDIESMELTVVDESLDLILCLDVLEHLREPWSVIERLHSMLKPGGVLIASIPNVRHYSVLWPLIIRGRWDYTPAGILDRTHMRFFTKISAAELVSCSGMPVVDVIALGVESNVKALILNYLTLGLFREFFDYQYLFKVVKGK